ncbi:MAG: hypothetical protein KGI98_11695 [Euryarchaeota archaeon]|nr:hypothetical protein [Euryarchaeota archaeon]MDE1880534.1 hypothetical protein [Euryarchaeota archaeon]MDE2045528.1 hypothetical protein [Thermoplasmata archaeon]
MSEQSGNTASEHANNAERTTCPTCGRPIGAAPAAPGIAALRANSEASLEATVASVGPTREVVTSRGPAEVADAVLQDASGTVKLVLWGPQTTKLQAGQRVRLAGAWVKEYRGRLQLSLGSAASMVVLGP